MSVESVGSSVDVADFEISTSYGDLIADPLKSFGSLCMTPFWKAETYAQYCFLQYDPNHPKFGQSPNKVIEYAKRFFFLLGSILAMGISLPFALSTFALTKAAQLLESCDYRYVKGDIKPESVANSTRIFHLNTCMFYGGLPYLFGGVRSAEERFEELVKRLRDENPDMIFLCEFNRMLSNPMVQALKDRYSDFIVDIGLNAAGMESCLFVASRRKIVSAPKYVPYDPPASGDQRFMNRGFIAVETEDKWYLYTHLHPRDQEADRVMRQKQLEKIQAFIDSKTGNKPCVLLGDLNINRMENPNADYQEMIKRGHFLDPQTPITRNEELIDYILVNEKIPLSISIFDTRRDELSDHHGLIGTFS